MKFWSRIIAVLAVAGLVVSASANGAPIGASHPIDGILGPGEQGTLIAENHFDLSHVKHLWFVGRAASLETFPGRISIQFDWLGPNGPVLTDPWFFDLPSLAAGGAPLEIDLHYEIPFCPPQVSFHVENVGNASVRILGVFSHWCLVPDSGLGLAPLLGLLGLVGAQRIARRRAA